LADYEKLKEEDADLEAWILREQRNALARQKDAPVCTENLSSGVVVVKSAKDGV
jgi:hypothetical protein